MFAARDEIRVALLNFNFVSFAPGTAEVTGVPEVAALCLTVWGKHVGAIAGGPVV